MKAEQPNRLGEGGRIDRGWPLVFTFDGASYHGFAGDTLASALLANDVRLVGRSFKYHRRRGIYSAGPEEPNALVQLRHGGRTEPNTRATMVELFDGLEADSQNRWPTLAYDWRAINQRFARLMPAGFYYKTFMWPPKFWMFYERQIRRAAGLGHSPRSADPDHYAFEYAHCDVLVVGSGPAGLAASLGALEHKLRFVTIEQEDSFGGTVYHYPRNKIVMTAPMQLPILGKVKMSEISKEALLEFWQGVVKKTGLKINFGERMETIVKNGSMMRARWTVSSILPGTASVGAGLSRIR